MSSEVFTPLADDQLGRLALIEAIRANTDAVNRLSRHSDATDAKLDAITVTLGGIDRRLAIIENNSLPRDLERVERDVAALKLRVDALEAERQQRKGALGLAEWVGRNWPALVAIGGLIAVLVRSGSLI